MKTRTYMPLIRLTAFILFVLIAFLFASRAHGQDVNITNPAPPMPDFPSQPFQPVTVSNVVTAVPAGVTQVAKDGYSVFSGISLTNPLAINLVALKNGSHYGGGIEAHSIVPGNPVSVGFGVFGIQTESKDAAGNVSTKLNFYDATINLSVSQVETIPVLNLPITLRIFSGPFASLNGGVLLGEQSGASGDVIFQVAKDWFITAGGGVVNCAGAAAAGLKSTLPMAHAGLVGTF